MTYIAFQLIIIIIYYKQNTYKTIYTWSYKVCIKNNILSMQCYGNVEWIIRINIQIYV